MGGVGPELIILIIALVIVLAWKGPASLPRLGEAFGKAVRGARENMPGGSKDKSDGSTASELPAGVSQAAAPSTPSASAEQASGGEAATSGTRPGP
jgi:Sec-independent protein translocase protein TatA